MKNAETLAQFVARRKLPYEYRSDGWHNFRAQYCGMSQLATVIGQNQYSEVDSFYISKVVEAIRFKNANYYQELICNYNELAVNMTNVWWGTVLEPVVKSLLEAKYKTEIKYDDYFVCDVDTFGGTPDGIGNINNENVLFEIKCPITRKSKYGEVPTHYYPQILGLLDIFCEHVNYALYVDAVFRRCSIEQLGFMRGFNPEPAKDKRGPQIPIEWGIIGFYYNKDNKDNRVNEDNKDSKETKGLIDFGDGPRDKLDKLFAMVDSRRVKYWSDGIRKRPDDFVKYCAENGYVAMGYMPWKLYSMDIVRVDKKENYLDEYREYVKELLQNAQYCANLESPKEIVQHINNRYYSNNNNTFDQYLSDEELILDDINSSPGITLSNDSKETIDIDEPDITETIDIGE